MIPQPVLLPEDILLQQIEAGRVARAAQAAVIIEQIEERKRRTEAELARQNIQDFLKTFKL